MNPTKANSKVSNVLNNIINTLQLPRRLRTSNDLIELMEVTQNSEFFKRIFREIQVPDLHRICCMYMTLEEHSSESPVYSIGDKSINVYFLLNGSVTLDLPKKLKTSISIPKEFQPIVKDLKLSLTNESIIDYKFEKSLKALFDDVLQWDARIADDVFMCKHRDVAETINPGESFGIPGLFTDRLKSHTALASEKIYLAVLSKQSLKKAVAAYNDKRINDRIEFLHQLSLFSAWTRASISRFLDLLTYADYTCNQRIFKEGSQAEFAVFVMNGEVKLTKAQITNKKVIETMEFAASSAGPLRLGKAREIVKCSQMQLVVKGKNAIIGFDDLISLKKQHSYSCFCYSSRAEVLILSKQVFMERINRPENFNYIKTKTSGEKLWLSERVKEINETDLTICRNTCDEPKIKPEDEVNDLKKIEEDMKIKGKIEDAKKEKIEEIMIFDEVPRPKTNTVRIRSDISRNILRRKSMCEAQESIPNFSRGHQRRTSCEAPSSAKSPRKKLLSRLPPPNFLQSYRKKKYGEPADPPFFTYCSISKTS